MSAKGLLLVLADPAPSLEEEFNDWYDTEHLPERAAIPGFETARRFTSLGDGPRYAAIYDLANLDVLEEPPYQAVSGVNFSPWTKRVAGRAHPTRLTAWQAAPGDRVTGLCARMLIVKFHAATGDDAPAIRAGLDASFGDAPGLLQTRVFVGAEPRPDFVVAIAEFSANFVPALRPEAFGACGRRIDLAATYRPYRG